MIKAHFRDSKFSMEFPVKDNEIRLRDFLGSHEISKRTLTATKYNGGKLTVNGIERDVRYLLHKEDIVEIVFPPEKMSEGLTAQDGKLTIIYEDDTIIILNKPPGQSTIPSFNHSSGTIANFIAGKFARESISSTVHIVTRLDHNTSGLICIAKNRHIHHLLGKQLMQSFFQRQYEAIVEGHVSADQFTINERIGRKDGSIIERMVREDGQVARTDVQVIGRYAKNGYELTRLALNLHTGRTHQIRVHLNWLGHSIAGDDLYGGSKSLISRQALHCTSIQFTHPITGERLAFRAEIPEDMMKLLT